LDMAPPMAGLQECFCVLRLLFRLSVACKSHLMVYVFFSWHLSTSFMHTEISFDRVSVSSVLRIHPTGPMQALSQCTRATKILH
jgi:hypothetical protein